MVNDREAEFLWKLFRLHLAGVPDALLEEHINTIYEVSLELDRTFEAGVDSFALSHDHNLLDMSIIEALKRRFFTIERHVQLVAVMLGRGKISLEESADFLEVSRSDLEQLPISVGHVLDVAWLINEDRRDGVMGADADHLLKDALAIVATDFLNHVRGQMEPGWDQIRHSHTS